MEYFSIVKDSDIFENPLPEPKEYISRPTVKGIVIDSNDNIATYHIHGRSLFPGGGVEGSESHEDAFIRECKEEIGCDIDIISSLGNAIELRSKMSKRYEIHFFIARVIGKKGKPTTTQSDELNIKIEWLPKEKIISILESQIENLSKDVYMPHFACRTHLAAFNEYLKLQK